MDIRFACSSCQRPIEVDDEWANRSVRCPYCDATVIAPGASTLSAESVPPLAQPADTLSSAPYGPPPVPTSGNLVAISALVAVMLAVGMLLAAGMVLAPHFDELAEVNKAVEANDQQGVKDAMQKLLESYGHPPPWLLHAFVLFLGAGFAWLAGLVGGLLGLRNRRRRGVAIAALVVAAGLPVMMCCSGGM